MKSFLKQPFECMLKGLAYWLAYKAETSVSFPSEAETVAEASQILISHLQSGFKIKLGTPYDSIYCSCGKKYADLTIWNSGGTCECIIEFKLADATNGGYKADVKKMHCIKSNCTNIDCYVVILYRKSCSQNIPKQLVNKDGQACRKKISIPVNTKTSQIIKTRRVCNAIGSKNAKKMKKVVCIELV